MSSPVSPPHMRTTHRPQRLFSKRGQVLTTWTVFYASANSERAHDMSQSKTLWACIVGNISRRIWTYFDHVLTTQIFTYRGPRCRMFPEAGRQPNTFVGSLDMKRFDHHRHLINICFSETVFWFSTYFVESASGFNIKRPFHTQNKCPCLRHRPAKITGLSNLKKCWHTRVSESTFLLSADADGRHLSHEWV